jgi:hypothetical protein
MLAVEAPVSSTSRPLLLLGVVVLAGVLVGCSTGRLGTTRSLMAPEENVFDLAFEAARSALLEMGARLTVDNRAAGRLVGLLDVEPGLAETSLEVTLQRIGSPPGSSERGMLGEVQVAARARQVGVDDETAAVGELLRDIERTYLDLVQETFRGLGGRRGLGVDGPEAGWPRPGASPGSGQPAPGQGSATNAR